MRTLVHVTHEAIHKVGGIGAVLQGLFTSQSYNKAIDRSILVCPLFTRDDPPELRLGPEGEVLFSSIDGIVRHPIAHALAEVAKRFGTDIVYGRRKFHDPETGVSHDPEVILVDVGRVDGEVLNLFKFRLWEEFGLSSNAYEHLWEFSQYLNLAPPTIECLHALGVTRREDECFIVAHEFMGMPTALAAILDGSPAFRTVFYAHEVAPIRKIVEDHPGHDTAFYNILKRAKEQGSYVQDVFGDQRHYFKYDLVAASRFCDNVLAVGDDVVRELRFLDPAFAHVDIDRCYNGIPAYPATMDELRQSQDRMRGYAENLLGWRPDYIFTHVTRMAVSKGLWRDLRVLGHVEEAFRKTGETAVLFVLSTELPRRPADDIRNMERWWKWPVAHREGSPDLSGGEANFYVGVQEFNARSRNVKVLYVNQFGWERALCGGRMPADMRFLDVRRGTQVEFGQSVYEPFGIAQIEPLSFGAICVITNVCGCAGFVRAVAGEDVPNVLVADYTDLGGATYDIEGLLALDRDQRDILENNVAQKVAAELLHRLPRDDGARKALLERGYAMAQQMSWEVVARDYLLPALDRASRKHRIVQVA